MGTGRRRAFSLMEVALAVGIVALLVVIALPRYEASQMRSKISQARGDLRNLAMAVEAYAVDYGVFPGDGSQYCWGYPNYPYDGYWYVPVTVTTPVAYIGSTYVRDPFRTYSPPSLKFQRYRYTYVDMTWGTAGTRGSPSTYYEFLKSWFGSWKLNSSGPDGTFGPYYDSGSYPGNQYSQLQMPYDPSNGTRSTGDILRSQRQAEHTQ